MFTSAKAVAAGQIATGFVHEVKNSLNTIALTVKNIGKRIQKEPDIKSKLEYINKIKAIETEIWRSYELSKRLQRFGQRMTPQKLETYLNEVVTNTLELLESTIKKQKIKLDLKLDSALDKHDIAVGKPLKGNPIYIDKVQIEQVIINLILNAIEASNPRSRLLVETKFNESTAEIRITDYGKGITSEDLSEIFKPFFTTKQDGVGLGLYICKLIVEESHQGKMYVTTKPEKGTTFSVQLPIKTKS
jgi:signal transduction histidine kinase